MIYNEGDCVYACACGCFEPSSFSDRFFASMSIKFCYIITICGLCFDHIYIYIYIYRPITVFEVTGSRKPANDFFRSPDCSHQWAIRPLPRTYTY